MLQYVFGVIFFIWNGSFKSLQTIKIIHDFIEYYSHICYLTARLYKRIESIIFPLHELYIRSSFLLTSSKYSIEIFLSSGLIIKVHYNLRFIFIYDAKALTRCPFFQIFRSMTDFKKIGIYHNPDLGKSVLEGISNSLKNHQMEPVILNPSTEVQENIDLILTVGGDGTVLAGLIHLPNCPVLAVNYGTVGFLTTGNPEDLDKILERIQQGRFVISERSILECLHPQGTAYAVNELVIKGATRLVNMALTINGHPIRKIRGDGFIVGTATGSTGYLLAAGSPIVMPELRCMILSGLNEYDFRARHLVITHDSRVELEILTNTREKEIHLAADGQSQGPLVPGDKVLIRESERRAKLIFMEPDYFFQNLSSRLSWFQRTGGA